MDENNFDIDAELEKAGIPIWEVYEPYKQTVGRIIRAEFLKHIPNEDDTEAVKKFEAEYPDIRDLKDKQIAWLQSFRESAKERSKR